MSPSRRGVAQGRLREPLLLPGPVGDQSDAVGSRLRAGAPGASRCTWCARASATSARTRTLHAAGARASGSRCTASGRPASAATTWPAARSTTRPSMCRAPRGCCCWLSRGDTLVAQTDPPLISLVAAAVAVLKRARLVNWLHDVFPEIATLLGANPLPAWLDGGLRRLRDLSLARRRRQRRARSADARPAGAARLAREALHHRELGGRGGRHARIDAPSELRARLGLDGQIRGGLLRQPRPRARIRDAAGGRLAMPRGSGHRVPDDRRGRRHDRARAGRARSRSRQFPIPAASASRVAEPTPWRRPTCIG